jgi:hypothetical protein
MREQYIKDLYMQHLLTRIKAFNGRQRASVIFCYMHFFVTRLLKDEYLAHSLSTKHSL